MLSADSNLARKYQKLEPREHVLTRPSMYIGSIEPEKCCTWVFDEESKQMIKKEITYVPGLYKIFDEILTNAIDHAMRLQTENVESKYRVKNIKIIIDKTTGIIEVFNDGMGIDIAQHPEHNIYVPEMIFGHMLTSANYEDSEERLVGGQNGLGAKCCNIFSQWFEVETVDPIRKKIFIQKFRDNMCAKGNPLIESCSKKSYTKISFMPDYERFGCEGITDDIYAMFAKRAYDACALTSSEVNVYLNDVKLEYKTFEKYVDLYLGSKSDRPRIYEKINDRWEIIASFHDEGGFEHMSFVNGIWSIKGGRHVEHLSTLISKKLCDILQQRKKLDHARPQHVKDHLVLFVKCYIPNAAFDSQSKETMITPVSKWNTKLDLSEQFMDKLSKSGIAELVQDDAEHAGAKALKQTDGKKKSVLKGIPKLHDATDAGTKKSENCSLILTEGDSALSMAISGRSVVGSKTWGAFPLKGKIVNVRDASNKKLIENEELSLLKKIIGLETGKEYTDTKDLRYNRIVVMTDQDFDGSHIRALLCNWIACQWPSLLKRPGFITTLLTPIIKASKGNITHEFFCIKDFEIWREQQTSTSGWKVKWFKGLATSSSQEAKEYFKKMRLVEYTYSGDECGESLDLAFNKKRADARKQWLQAYDSDYVLDYSQKSVTYKDVIHKDLIHFSNYDIERSIPSMVDGLKVSQRKIMYTAFKINMVKEMRVSTAASTVTATSLYHHVSLVYIVQAG
jgi:DNA topoisomerase-2